MHAQVIVPAGLDLPEGYDEETWQRARIAARPPRILLDRPLLSEGSRAALEKQRGITLVEATELYYELGSWGYGAPFSVHQKRRAIPEKLKGATVEERLCEDHRSKRRLVARISVTTYVKHGRVMRAVGDMLMDMQLIDQNPFGICKWGNKEIAELKSTEGDRKREAWDDRIFAAVQNPGSSSDISVAPFSDS